MNALKYPLCLIACLALPLATAAQDYQPKFSLTGKARGVYFADHYSGAGDTVTSPRSNSGHVMADLGMRLRPNPSTEVLAMVRVRNDYGGFWGSGVTFDLRQLQVKGLIQDRIRYTLGDVDYALTPFTFHRPGPLMAGILPSGMAQLQKNLAGYDAFITGNNTWRQQGAVVEFRTDFARGPRYAEHSAFAFRQRAGFSGQATESWAFGGRTLWTLNNPSPLTPWVKVGLNYVGIQELAGTSAATDLYGNHVLTGDFQIVKQSRWRLQGELGSSSTQWVSGDQDADYMIDVKGVYWLKELGISTAASLRYTEVGPDFYSPTAQTTPNISSLAPAAFTRIGNSKSVREWTYLDLFRESNLYRYRWNSTLGSDNNTYLIMDPRGLATPNRRRVTADFAGKALGIFYKVEGVWAQEIRGQGTDVLTQFSRVDLDLRWPSRMGYGVEFRGLIRDQRAWRTNVGDDVPNTSYRLPWTSWSAKAYLNSDQTFSVEGGLLTLGHGGFAYDIIRNAENTVLDIRGGERSHQELLPNLCLNYASSEQSTLTLGWLGSYVKTLDANYSIQNLYVLYAITF
ncbi:MAG: hypothetical protein EBZ22_00220 [Flavobacteriia bacterium]|nr:hypothetical protein [Flavobacteriia bacterium]